MYSGWANHMGLISLKQVKKHDENQPHFCLF